jgi:hypothetical protein
MLLAGAACLLSGAWGTAAARAEFGIASFDSPVTNQDGTPDTQAGSHPYQFTTAFTLNTTTNSVGHTVPDGDVKDIQVSLPPGFVGDPSATPRCTFAQLGPDGTSCPPAAQIGVLTLTYAGQEARATVVSPPVYNMVPHPGEPALFEATAPFNVEVYIDIHVRTGADYGVTASLSNITTVGPLLGSSLTFWGVPADPSHDAQRCTGIDPSTGVCDLGPPTSVPLSVGGAHKAFLTNPTSCLGSLMTTISVDSWQNPGVFRAASFVSHDNLGNPVGLDGCNRLGFDPSISVAPDVEAASTPTGLTVGVHVPQVETSNPGGLAPANVKTTTVVLPAGVQLSPSAADGLQACSEAQIGFTGVNSQTGTDEFTSGVPSCPQASKIATVKLRSPLLPDVLEGAVYLAAPQNFAGGLFENPFGSLAAMYLVAQDPVSGVLVKLAGKVSMDSVTGQLVSTFENTPQLPFEDLELHFFGTARAPLSTPALCGTYTTMASIEPWSGNPPALPSSSFEITSGANGAACQDPQPFAPGFQAGSTNLQAGAFTPFTLTMTRPDADQTLSGVETQMPPGLLGTLSNVKLCGEPQASQGTCGEESLVGHTVVSVGLGNDPYTVMGGKVFITTGYKGAAYGLSIVDPAVAGPFVLDEGRPVVVRASISVDPHTAALRIVSDPLPTILDGIPLQIQHVNVAIDREKFMFNPTNCTKMAIAGTLSSSQGAGAPVSTPFQVTNCATLAFNPKFVVSTAGKTSRANGASLHVKLSYPLRAVDANIARVKVDLPKQLPSRLTTLQKACTAAIFESNPASCPRESVIGTARASTPILPVALEGPAYFVSHGGEAFPSLIVVLQGYGTTVDLLGTTFISKKGITSTTFKTVPDVPVGAFELTLPEGKYSALAANGNLCKSKLAMPTAFVAQNGAEIHESTKIAVTGCPRAKANKHKQGKPKKKPKK